MKTLISRLFTDRGSLRESVSDFARSNKKMSSLIASLGDTQNAHTEEATCIRLRGRLDAVERQGSLPAILNVVDTWVEQMLFDDSGHATKLPSISGLPSLIERRRLGAEIKAEFFEHLATKSSRSASRMARDQRISRSSRIDAGMKI